MSIKEVIESTGWKFKVSYASGSKVRVDAERRFFRPDRNDNRLSKWASRDYVDRLCREHYGKPLCDMNNIRW